MLNATRPIYFREPPIVRRALRPVRQREQVPEPVHLRIEDQLVMLMPESAGDLWIEPRIENLTRRRGDCPFDLDFHGSCPNVGNRVGKSSFRFAVNRSLQKRS